MIIYNKDKKEIGRIEEANGVTTLVLSIEGIPKENNISKEDLQERLNGLKFRLCKSEEIHLSYGNYLSRKQSLSIITNLSRNIGQTEQLLKDRFGV